MSTTIHVHYFAILREQRGLAAETLATSAVTAGELYEDLRKRHGFSLPVDRLRAAIDDEFAPMTAALRDGATVVFIPPVAGG